jgi:hypothetical protein
MTALACVLIGLLGAVGAIVVALVGGALGLAWWIDRNEGMERTRRDG